jgi:hypothetical protein
MTNQKNSRPTRGFWDWLWGGGGTGSVVKG